MNQWPFPWWGPFKSPFSGDVTQDIAPNTSWLCPQFEINFAGNHRVESEVVADVASYGTQLGALSEAVMELANGEKGEAVDRLKTLMDQIEEIKDRHEVGLEKKIKAELDQLKKRDPKTLKRLLDEYR